MNCELWDAGLIFARCFSTGFTLRCAFGAQPHVLPCNSIVFLLEDCTHQRGKARNGFARTGFQLSLRLYTAFRLYSSCHIITRFRLERRDATGFYAQIRRMRVKPKWRQKEKEKMSRAYSGHTMVKCAAQWCLKAVKWSESVRQASQSAVHDQPTAPESQRWKRWEKLSKLNRNKSHIP